LPVEFSGTVVVVSGAGVVVVGASVDLSTGTPDTMRFTPKSRTIVKAKNFGDSILFVFDFHFAKNKLCNFKASDLSVMILKLNDFTE
jgi:hypothetical protein